MFVITSLLVGAFALNNMVVAMVTHPDTFLAPRYSNAIWSYVEDTSPAETSVDDELNEVIQHVASATLGDAESRMAMWIEAIGKERIVAKMSQLDKHNNALLFVSTYGILQQLNFINLVSDEEHLQQANYLQEEASTRAHSLASLELMECLWPTVEDIRNPLIKSGLGQEGDDLWWNFATRVHTGECEIEFHLLSRTFLEADFASVLPEDREEYSAALMNSHDRYLASELAAGRCEDFS